MRRIFPLLCAIATLVVFAATADAAEMRFPQNGKQAFHLTVPKNWTAKTDARGGLLLVPPAGQQHAMLYLAIVVDDSLRAASDSAGAAQVAQRAARLAGIELSSKQDPARVTSTQGKAVFRGTAFYGKLAARRGFARTAKIVIIRLTPNTWAQLLVVSQPGMNSVELAALDRVLNSITLSSE